MIGNPYTVNNIQMDHKLIKIRTCALQSKSLLCQLDLVMENLDQMNQLQTMMLYGNHLRSLTVPKFSRGIKIY